MLERNGGIYIYAAARRKNRYISALKLRGKRGKESLLNWGLALLLDNKERGKHVALAWSR